MTTDPAIPNGLVRFHCSQCGRFLGFENIRDGQVYVLCKNCKGWTIIEEGDSSLDLTMRQVYDKLIPRAGGPGKPNLG